MTDDRMTMDARAEAVGDVLFDVLDRHVLASTTFPDDPSCSCGWHGDPYTYKAWKAHVGHAVLEAIDGSLEQVEGWRDSYDGPHHWGPSCDDKPPCAPLFRLRSGEPA